MTAPAQFPILFPEHTDYAAADFVDAPSNAEARAWLVGDAMWPSGRLVLWGEPGCGKTHMLRLWAAQRGAALRAGPELRGLGEPPDVAGVAVDAADAVADEAALLHLLNAAAEAGAPVLMAARVPPAAWPLALPDLASRVRASPAARVLPPDDALLRAVLARLLSGRQLAVAEDIQDWLLLRLPRTTAALREAALRLDRAGLAGRTAITRSVASRIVEEMASTAMRQDHET